METKKAILNALKDGEPYSYAQLEKKAKSNWRSVKISCRELEAFGLITVEHKKSHPKTKVPYSEVAITELGRKALRKLETL